LPEAAYNLENSRYVVANSVTIEQTEEMNMNPSDYRPPFRYTWFPKGASMFTHVLGEVERLPEGTKVIRSEWSPALRNYVIVPARSYLVVRNGQLVSRDDVAGGVR
jgi:hypothetical protein